MGKAASREALTTTIHFSLSEAISVVTDFTSSGAVVAEYLATIAALVEILAVVCTLDASVITEAVMVHAIFVGTTYSKAGRRRHLALNAFKAAAEASSCRVLLSRIWALGVVVLEAVIADSLARTLPQPAR